MIDKINTEVEELFVYSSLLEALTLTVTHFRVLWLWFTDK